MDSLEINEVNCASYTVDIQASQLIWGLYPPKIQLVWLFESHISKIHRIQADHRLMWVLHRFRNVRNMLEVDFAYHVLPESWVSPLTFMVYIIVYHWNPSKHDVQLVLQSLHYPSETSASTIVYGSLVIVSIWCETLWANPSSPTETMHTDAHGTVIQNSWVSQHSTTDFWYKWMAVGRNWILKTSHIRCSPDVADTYSKYMRINKKT